METKRKPHNPEVERLKELLSADLGEDTVVIVSYRPDLGANKEVVKT